MASLARGGDSGTKVVRWIARVLSLVVVAIVLLMFVGHLFEEEGGGTITRKEIAMLVIMSVLATVASFGLIFAWWRERIGGTMAVACALVLFVSLLLGVRRNGLYIASVVSVPFLVPGILFLMSSRRAGTSRAPTETTPDE